MKKITYLTSIDPVKSPGVANKILGTVEGARSLGHSADWVNIPPNPGFLSQFAAEINNSSADVLIIRSLCQYNFYLIPALISLGRKGKRIIIDVPTPNTVAIRELGDAKSSILRKVKDLAYLLMSGPVPYWFADRVVQYADESPWFLLGNRSKTRLLGNGIDVGSVPMRPSSPSWDGRRLNLVCVASLNYWHGIDLLIDAMARVNREGGNFTIFLKVIGKGAVFSQLEDQVVRLELGKYVQFLGFLTGEALHRHYEEAHLAVGSLALCRKNLRIASELKSREYCASGIPFVVVGKDPDFGPETPFRVELPNRANVDDLVRFFEGFDPRILQLSPPEIRRHAEKHLDFSVKVKEILS